MKFQLGVCLGLLGVCVGFAGVVGFDFVGCL
jgi:hypothetical protein